MNFLLDGFARGNAIFKASWRLLSQDKEWLCFPIFSLLFIAAMGPVLYFPAKFWVHTRHAHPFLQNSILLAVILYLFVAIAIFFNVALTACILAKISGKQPTLIYGINVALDRLPNIFIWAAFSTVIGLVVGAFENKNNGILGRILGGFLDVSWKVASCFVVSLLVMENLSPWAALKKSTVLVKTKWGNVVSREIALGLYGFLFASPGVVLLFLSNVFSKGHGQIHWSLFFFGLLLCVTAGLLIGVLGSIFNVLLFLYANDYDLAETLDPAILQATFRTKR